MDEKRRVKISRSLSKVLRHAPESLGLTLAPGGWVQVNVLLDAYGEHHFNLTREELDEVVAWNPKQRFSFDSTGTLIRANQGHSVEIDLQLEPQVPPDILYHGTGRSAVPAIRESGISKMNRHHVHLSPDVETALKVGSRHGSPVVIHIDAKQMHADGHIFFCSANGVWLVEFVPTNYFLKVTDNE